MRTATMQYVPLGNTELLVSRIALGYMGFADPTRGVNPLALDEQAAAPLFRRAVELGITLWDTANVYGGGTSEEIVGRAVTNYTRREDVVIATKVGLPMHDGPAGSGLSRTAIRNQVDASLARLGTDYIDLYQIHRFDPRTPVERWKLSMRCWQLGRSATSAPHRCGRGNSPRCSTPLHSTAARGSCRCRTSTASCSARTSGRCSPCSPTKAWSACPGAHWARDT